MGILTLANISAGIIVVWALILTMLEIRFPYQSGYKTFRKGFFMDLFWYTIVQSYALGLIIAYMIQWLDRNTDLSEMHLVRHWPLAGQFVFFLVVHDLWQYWFHRLQHRYFYLWRTHEPAHATPEVDWLVGSRSHALEILIAQTVEFAPIILLGASPEIPVLKALSDAVWGMYNHSNIRVRHGVMLYIFNGPELHRWHHALTVPKGGANFATKLSLWDWLWKTAYYPQDRLPDYGLRSEIAYPNYSYFRQLILAFRPRR